MPVSLREPFTVPLTPTNFGLHIKAGRDSRPGLPATQRTYSTSLKASAPGSGKYRYRQPGPEEVQSTQSGELERDTSEYCNSLIFELRIS
jgi:hypothetical protein